jgi:hypothetical protein
MTMCDNILLLAVDVKDVRWWEQKSIHGEKSGLTILHSEVMGSFVPSAFQVERFV